MGDYKVAIIGGGPAGMMAAIKAAQILGPHEVCILEKNDSLGRKLMLTGGGRCNITNMTRIHDQLEYHAKNKNFLKHALYTLPQDKLLAIFEEKGLDFHTEDKKRVFPDTESAEDVLDVLVEYLEDLDENSIEHELNEKMEPVFEIKTENLSLNASKIIVSTGGMTYPNTGSTGDGYKIAQTLSHSITDIKPGLVPFKIDDFLLNGLSGLALEDVVVSFKDGKKKTNVKGNILISHFGLTGPAIMDLSSRLLEKSDYDLLSGTNELYTNKISIDFSPDMSEDDIKSQITKDTPNNGKTTVKNYLKKFLPNSFIDYFLMSLNMSSQLTMANLTKKDKNKITDNIKRFPVEIASLEEELAKVTIGGIKSKEIDSKTLESKLVEGLYFAGEVLEVAGPSGGYNLQIAFATGYLAGEEAAKRLKE